MLRYMTAGESHGKGELAILDGVPAGLKIDENFINEKLKMRQRGYGRGGRMAIETDRVEIISGCRNGITIGSPIGLRVPNKDYKINELPDVKSPRPGHADLAGIQKYGFSDARDVLERASARETTMRVAVGAIAELILEEFGIQALNHVIELGGVKAETEDLSFDEILKGLSRADWNVYCADENADKLMCKEIDAARKEGNTLGGVVEVRVQGAPAGLGSYVQWDRRLDGRLAQAAMAIPAIKAVSIGEGVECASRKGSETHDSIGYDSKQKVFTRSTNNAGGLEGGVTNGEPIIVRAFMKPIATLGNPLKSIDIDTKKETEAATERSDVAAVTACGVIAEAVVAVEIASALLEKFGGDSINEIKRNHEAYLDTLKKM